MLGSMFTDPSGGAMPLGSHGDYEKKTFSVPAEVAKAARLGLKLREEFGRGGTDVGIARARQLSKGSPKVSLRDIVYIHSYFQRHAVDKLWQKDPPSNGRIAWLLWGGDPGRVWATRIYNEEVGRKPKSKKKPSRSRFDDPFEPSSSVIDVAREHRSEILETAGVFAGGLLIGAVIGAAWK
jgi:hypothetical protein